MVWVNLLPWRAERLRIQQRRWLLGVMVMLLLLLTTSVPLWGQRAVNQQTARLINQIGQTQLSIEQRLKQLTSLEAEREALRQQAALRLRRKQSLEQWRLFFQSLPQAMPDTLWLTAVTKSQQNLTVSGICQGPEDLARFRQNLRALALADRIKTGALSLNNAGQMLFHLQMPLSKEAGDDQ